MGSFVQTCDFDVSNGSSPCFHFECIVASGGIGRAATAEEVTDCARFTGEYCLALPQQALAANPGCSPHPGVSSNCSFTLDTASARSPCHAPECVEGTALQCAEYVAHYCSGVGTAVPACNIANPVGGEGCLFDSTVEASPCSAVACLRDAKSRHFVSPPLLIQVSII